MKKFCSIALAAVGMFFGGSAQAQWNIAVPGAELATAVGYTTMSLGSLSSAGGGVFFAQGFQTGSRNIIKIDLNQPVNSRVTLVTSDTTIVSAIDAANGSTAAPLATNVRIQATGVNANGKVLVYVDGSAMPAALLAIEPNPPHTINVLSCDVNGGASPVEGGDGMTVVGNTAYITVNGAFSATEDSIRAVNTATLVNDGSLLATIVAGEATLTGATGDTAASQQINDVTPFGTNVLVGINSGAAGSNDDIVSINVASNTATKLVAATALESAISIVDVGYPAVAAYQPAGKVWVANAFGTATSYADEAVVEISNITNSTTFNTAVDSVATIASNLGLSTSVFIGTDALKYVSGESRLYAGTTNGAGLIRKNITNAAVANWTLY